MLNTVIPVSRFAARTALFTFTAVVCTTGQAQQSLLSNKSSAPAVAHAAASTAVPGAASAATVQATSCESLLTQIENKIRAAGVSQVSLEIIDSAAAAGRRVVGSCGMGARKIVYTAAPNPALAVAPPPPLLPSEPAKPKEVKEASAVKTGGTTASPAAKPATPAVAVVASPARPKAKTEVIWTECKDGSLTLGECKKK